MKCQNCGHNLTDGSRFCPACGTPVPVVPVGQAEPTPHPPAKKGAGKKFLIGCLALVLVGGIGAGGFLLIRHQIDLEQRLVAAEQRADKAEEQAADNELPTNDDQALPEDPVQEAPQEDVADEEVALAQSLEGTWTGEVVEVEQVATSGIRYGCYGAQLHDAELVITSIDSIGKVHCSFKAVIHHHDPNDLTSDVDGHEDDIYFSSDELVSTLDNDGSFEVSGYIPGSEDSYEVEVSILEQSSATTRLEMVVTSYYGIFGSKYRDTYHLTKV